MPELAYVNGKVMPIEEARVPVEDRGYQFGDAVYEFFATYHHRIFALEAHLDRLERSLNALSFDPIDRETIRRAIVETAQQAGIARAGIYLQISRGVAPRNHAFPAKAEPQVVITVRPVPEIPQHVMKNGADVITVSDIRWGRCDIKTTQLLPNAWAKQQAIEAGAHDAIFVSGNGVVREGTASNVFIVSKGTLITHPLTNHILPGITRATLIDLCHKGDLQVSERFFHRKELLAADEVFLTGTITEVLPVTRIDGQAVSEGKPGPVARQLFEWLREVATAK